MAILYGQKIIALFKFLVLKTTGATVILLEAHNFKCHGPSTVLPSQMFICLGTETIKKGNTLINVIKYINNAVMVYSIDKKGSPQGETGIFFLLSPGSLHHIQGTQ